MRSTAKLKKLIIDITVPVLIFSLIAGALIAEQKGIRIGSGNGDGGLIDEDTWHEIRNVNAGAISENAPTCLLVFDEADDESVAVKENIQYVLNSINVKTSTQKVFVPEDNEDELEADEADTTIVSTDIKSLFSFQEYDEVIFCLSNFAYLGVNYQEFNNWISSGGHAMFAAGMEATEDLLAWSETLGMEDAVVPEIVLADSLRFESDIMAGTEGREFSDDVINCDVLNVSINKDCICHISTADDNKVPLIWENSIGSGKVIVCNADLFDAKADRGIIAATYCKFYPAFVYPVINAAVYCIDDCPAPAPAGYDDNVLSQYGYTVDDYIANVWMPAMMKIAEDYDIRFTTFTIQSYDDDVDGPFENEDNIKSAKYYASLILSTGGEIGIHGYNHQPLVLEGFEYDEENEGYVVWPSVKKIIESIETVIKYTEGLADDLYVQAYIAPSNVICEEALHEIQANFEDLRIYAGVYIGTPDQMVQEFTVLENGTVYCPRLTADMQMEDSEWWLQINELNYHYVESNFIHPDDILDEERSDGGDFSQMLASYKEMIEWNKRHGLRTTTISECGAAVQKYCNINYTQELKGNILSIDVDGLIDTAYMMLRLDGKRPVSMEGGNYKKLSDNVYILEINSETVTVKLVNK